MLKQFALSLCLLSCLHLDASEKKGTPRTQRRDMSKTMTREEKIIRKNEKSNPAQDPNQLPEIGKPVSLMRLSGQSSAAILQALVGSDDGDDSN